MIGKLINKLLTDDAALVALVQNKIFPLVMSLETLRPSVVYVVESITPQYSKDGWAGDDCTFRVTSYADSYSQAIEVAQAVREALELVSGTHLSIDVENIYMTGREEFYQFDADVYIIRLNFTTKINSYG
jgi:hypothetical protein